MNRCPHCGFEYDGTHACPSCGRTREVSPDEAGRGASLVRRYFRDLGDLLFRPGQFYRRMPLGGGLSGPLAFALVTNWIGAAVAYLWSGFFGFEERMNSMLESQMGSNASLREAGSKVMQFFVGTGSVIISPFLTLFSILFAAIFVFAGARLLVSPGREGSPDRVTYESAARIVAFAQAPAILAVIPFLGGFLSWAWIMALTVIGSKEVYRTGSGKAVTIALFPYLLFFGFMLLILVGLFAVFMKMIGGFVS